MKIVNLKEFRNLPEGTVYSEYEPYVFYGLLMKGDNLGHDFTCQDLWGNLKADSTECRNDKCDLAESGKSVELDFDFYGRDGMFDENQLFAVYEKEDVQQLIKCLQDSLEVKS